MTLSPTKPNLPLPDPVLAGVFLCTSTVLNRRITVAAGTVGPFTLSTVPGPGCQPELEPSTRGRRPGSQSPVAHSQTKIPKQSYAGLGILSCGLN